MDYLKVITTNLLYIIHPFLLLSRLLLTILAILTAPLLHLGNHILSALCLPIHILAKFETLYIFFGVAILVGLLIGTSLHYVFNFLISVLRIESLSGEDRRLKTITEFREERKHRQKPPVIGTEDQGFKPKGSLAGLAVGNEAGQEKDRVEGAYIRVGEAHARAERKAKKNLNLDWGKGEGERGMERGRRERDGRWGRKDVLTSTILEEDDSSDVGF